MDEQAAPSADSVADEILLARFACGDQTALHDLMRRYMSAALAIADGRLRWAGLAEDAVQLAFIKVARHAARFDSERGFAPWFYTILRRVCADLAHGEVRYRLCLQRAVPELEAVQQPSDPEAYDAVRDALRGLRPKDREILILRSSKTARFLRSPTSWAAPKKRPKSGDSAPCDYCVTSWNARLARKPMPWRMLHGGAEWERQEEPYESNTTRSKQRNNWPQVCPTRPRSNTPTAAARSTATTPPPIWIHGAESFTRTAKP